MKDLLFIFLQSLWLILPAGFANMSPVLAAKLIPRWNTPVDLNTTWKNKKIFGSHKTFRGIVSGTITGFIIFYFQQWLYEISSIIKNLSLFDYQHINPLFGAGLGLSALIGDLIKSFFKRRIEIPPGKPWIPFDEIDWILGALIYFSFFIKLEWQLLAAGLISGLSLHFLIRGVAYLLKIVSSPL